MVEEGKRIRQSIAEAGYDWYSKKTGGRKVGRYSGMRSSETVRVWWRELNAENVACSGIEVVVLEYLQAGVICQREFNL